MSTSITKTSVGKGGAGNSTGTYIFGTTDSAKAQVSVDSSYTTQIEIVDGQGELIDIVYGGQEDKITATEFTGVTGSSSLSGLGGSYSAGGATGYITKVNFSQSNEDVAKTTIEAIGSPDVSTTTTQH
jgi:hypothetical protein